MEEKNTNWNLIIALLAFIGTALGAYVASYLQQERWEQQTNHESNQAILQARIGLIERTTVALSAYARADALASILTINAETSSKIYDICVQEFNNNGDTDACKHVQIIENGSELNAELNNINIEVNTTLLMDSLCYKNSDYL